VAFGVEKMILQLLLFLLPLFFLGMGLIITAICINQDESPLVFILGGFVGTVLVILSVGALLTEPQNSFEVYEISNLTVEDACKNILLINNITLKENEYLNYSVEDYNIICKIDTKSKDFGVILK
jgi:hypothetical protein